MAENLQGAGDDDATQAHLDDAAYSTCTAALGQSPPAASPVAREGMTYSFFWVPLIHTVLECMERPGSELLQAWANSWR